MLKNLKSKAKDKKQGKGKQQQTKKQKKTKVAKEADQQQEEQCGDLVEIDYSKKQQKAKPVKKKQTTTFEEVQIETRSVPQIKKQEKKLTSWVPASQQDALNYKKQFKLEEHIEDFESISDESLNKQIKEKIAKDPPKQLVKETAEGIKTGKIEKTAQQLKMEREDNDGVFLKKKPQNNILFTNIQQTNINFKSQKPKQQTNLKELQKTRQQLKMQEMERRQQQIKTLAPKKETWIGFNKEAQKQKPAPPGIIFRDTPMTFTNSAKVQQLNGINLAPLYIDNGVPKTAAQQKTNNNIKQAQIQKPKVSRRMDDDDGLVFLSKKQKQQRKLKREKQAQKILQSAK